jgi:adenylosuccinate lyase
MQRFITALPLPEPERRRLLALTPSSYTGLAASLARRV